MPIALSIAAILITIPIAILPLIVREGVEGMNMWLNSGRINIPIIVLIKKNKFGDMICKKFTFELTFAISS